MISEVCHDLRNYFCYDRIFGTFKIENGMLHFSDSDKSLDLVDNQYFRIVGSLFNDAVWKWNSEGIEGLTDEGEFLGSVWKMNPPKDFLALIADIETWQDKFGAVDGSANSPYSSESFGGYSYSKSSGSGSNGSTSVTWKNAFASRLNTYRKI